MDDGKSAFEIAIRPVVYRANGESIPLQPEDLPVSLPHIDEYKPTQDGLPPLARAKDWMHTQYKGEDVTRETNTMPQWAGSWYPSGRGRL